MTEEFDVPTAYFVIFCTKDGDVSVKKYTRPELLRALENPKENFATIRFIERMPPDPDPLYWEPGLLVIRGEIVVPHLREKILSCELP